MVNNQIKVSIHHNGKSFNKGLKLIEAFKKINHIDFKLEIRLDMAEKDLGYFNYILDENILYINPIRCINNKHHELSGHITDCSIFATICHEFSHYLDLRYDLMTEYYQKKITLKKLIMTKYAKTNIVEELADIVSIYLINPYYLKLIDLERYKWLKTKFKSPVPCGPNTFLKYYTHWPEQKKQLFCKTYNTTVKE